MTLSEMLKKTADKFPEREAVVWKGARLIYADLLQDASSVATFLIKEGLMPGERVALLMENSPQYTISYFGILMAGGCVVALNPNTTVYELIHPIKECEPRVIICGAKVLPLLQDCLALLKKPKAIVIDGNLPPEMERTVPGLVSLSQLIEAADAFDGTMRCQTEDLAQIIYTSGTTGKAKGIMLTHRNLVANTQSIAQYLGLCETDRVLVILPFFYSYGNSLLLTHVASGGALVIADQFVFLNSLLSLMKQERVTGFSGVPASYAMLLRQSLFPKTHFAALRYMTCAGGALPTSHILELQSAHPGVDLVVMYGQTEASARLSYLEPKDLPRKLGSIGKGIPGVTLKVIGENGEAIAPGETGEIVARGKCIMRGYWKLPKETAQVLRDGWLHTGDMATVDEEAFIFIKGRRSDMIKCGSYRIHPIEIEGALNAHPIVVESAVIGMEDEMLGESIVAFVVLKKEEALSVPDLLQAARKFLPTHKLPKAVRFRNVLPKTASGKIRREALRKILANSTLSQYS
ncbi:MAG: class I adenylate-forming enzyme family protein [Nitrospiria bacterium]